MSPEGRRTQSVISCGLVLVLLAVYMSSGGASAAKGGNGGGQGCEASILSFNSSANGGCLGQNGNGCPGFAQLVCLFKHESLSIQSTTTLPGVLVGTVQGPNISGSPLAGLIVINTTSSSGQSTIVITIQTSIVNGTATTVFNQYNYSDSDFDGQLTGNLTIYYHAPTVIGEVITPCMWCGGGGGVGSSSIIVSLLANYASSTACVSNYQSTCGTFPTSISVPVSRGIQFVANAAGGISPYTVKWTFSDGYTSTLSSLTHVFRLIGGNTVSLSVTDLTGTSVSLSMTVSVTANFAPPYLSSFAGVTQYIQKGCGGVVLWSGPSADANSGIMLADIEAGNAPCGYAINEVSGAEGFWGPSFGYTTARTVTVTYTWSVDWWGYLGLGACTAVSSDSAAIDLELRGNLYQQGINGGQGTWILDGDASNVLLYSHLPCYISWAWHGNQVYTVSFQAGLGAGLLYNFYGYMTETCQAASLGLGEAFCRLNVGDNGYEATLISVSAS